jgi:hypothetical protein
MTRPPPWLSALLSLFSGDDRFDPIVGDLLEDYALDRVPRHGRTAADLWLLRQILSLAPNRLFDGGWPMKSLTIISLFMILAAAWLVYMEQILCHPGHVERSVLDAGLVLGSLLVVVWILRRRGRWLGVATGLYAVAALAFGTWELWHLFHGADFEGFALVISLALCAQAALVLTGLVRSRRVEV